jgi:hypothetical protein
MRREMFEVRRAGDIADRIDLLVTGAEPTVHHNAAHAVADTGGIERQMIEVRLAAGREQNVRTFDGLFAALLTIDRDDVDLEARRRAPHPHHLDTAAQHHAFAGKPIEHNGGAFRIVAGQRGRGSQTAGIIRASVSNVIGGGLVMPDVFYG